MKVIVPYTRRIKAVTAALDATGYDYEAIDVSESPFKYFYVIKELWSAGEAWINVEHDIIVNPDTFSALEDCPADWDVAAYEYKLMKEGAYAGLGCCKFSEKLIARNPHAMNLDPNWYGWDKSHKPKHWCRVDAMLKENLLNNNERPHAHDLVHHLGDGYPSHAPCHEQAMKMKGLR